jgi:hypothetical protein
MKYMVTLVDSELNFKSGETVPLKGAVFLKVSEGN